MTPLIKPSEGARGAAPFLLVALFAAAATVVAVRSGAWHDEAWSLTTARLSLMETSRRALSAEGQPPLYFLLLNFWLRLDDSVAFARLLSLLCTVGAALLTLGAMRQATADRSAGTTWLTLAVMLCSPFTMYLATEARSYGLQSLLGAALAWVVARAGAKGEADFLDAAALAGIGITLAYVHYVAVLPVAGAGIALAAIGVLRLRALLAIASVGAIAVLPLLAAAAKSFELHAGPPSGLHPEALSTFLVSVEGAVLPHAHGGRPWMHALSAAFALAASIGALASPARRIRPGGGGRAVLVAAGCALAVQLPLVLVAGPAAAKSPYLSAALPLLWTALLVGLRSLVGRAWAAALLTPLCLVGAWRSTAINRAGVRVGSWRSVADSVRGEPAVAGPLFVFPPLEALTARLELGSAHRVVGFPRDFDGSRPPRPEDFSLDEAESLRAIGAATRGGLFWFAYEVPPLPGPVDVEKKLEETQEFLDRRCQVRRRDLHPGPPGSGDATWLLVLACAGPAP